MRLVLLVVVIAVLIAPVAAVLPGVCNEASAADRRADEAARDVQLMKSLDIYWGTRGAYPSDPAQSHEDRLRAFLRERLARDDFYAAVLPRLFETLSDAIVNTPIREVFDSAVVDGKTIYYLEKPCAIADTSEVHPWWDMASTMRVCNSDYRPDADVDVDSKDRMYCESVMASRACGCGPNLLACAGSGDQVKAIRDASQEEVLRTIQYVIEKHLPFERVLTMNETVRSDLGDFAYVRSTAYRTHTLSYVLDTKHPTLRLRARPPEFQGGLLSTPLVLWYHDVARRVVVSRIWSDFLCTPLRSSNVLAHQMFEIEDPSLRSHSHMGLATKHGCRDCHSRLENAYRATNGFTAYAGFRFVPENMEHEPSRFYVRDANDERAEGESSIAWLSKTLVAQPEFKQCMVGKVESFVYGDRAVSPATHGALMSTFSSNEDFAALLEKAFLERYAEGAQ